LREKGWNSRTQKRQCTPGCQFLFSLDREVSVEQILEVFADRAAIEQDFHDVRDVREVWGPDSTRSATFGQTSGLGI